MQKVLTAAEMREVDRLTTEKYGIPSLLLMENAAHAAARVICEKMGGSVKGKSVLVLCGKGNNGGDGAALARILWTMGADVFVYLIGKIEDTKGDAQANFKIIYEISESKETNDPNQNCLFITEVEEMKDLAQIIFEQKEELIIDSFFGTGLTKPLEKDLMKLVGKISQWKPGGFLKNVISLDLPSGLNADLAQPIGKNFQADLTITFTAPKLANVFPPASNFNGELIVANIGSPQELIDNAPSKLFVSEKKDARNWLEATKPQSNSYKKNRGTTLIVAGSENYSGAAVLAANACFSAGAGMVTAAVPNEIHQIAASKTLDEVIVKSLEKIDISKEKVDVVAIGCGMANDEDTHRLVRETVKNRQTTMVLDAEALNAIAPFDLQSSDEFPLILTPHIGEFSRLLGREVGADKIAEVREFSQKHNVILVLKGERSLIAKPDGTVVINPTGNAGVSRAGAGDTLTGIITSFLAQTFAIKETNIENAFQTVIAALYIAGLAGDIAAEKFSQRLMTATDVRRCLQDAIASLNDV